MTDTLYWSPDTGAFAVEAVLLVAGADYRRELVDTATGAQRSVEYTAVNPMAQVPAMRLADGTVVTESAAMILHVCDRHPDAGLLPPAGSSARARAYRWLMLLAGPYYEADLRCFYAERYTTDADGADGVRAAATRQLDHILGIVDDALVPVPYLAGVAPGAVDLYLFVLALWHPGRAEALARFAHLDRHLRVMRRHPVIERLWPAYYPTERGHFWSTWNGWSVP